MAVQLYLDELAGVPADQPAEALVRTLLARAVSRLHLLCANQLFRQYPRLARGPLNLQPEDVLSGVVERLIKAMRNVRPTTVRQFFALANQHMRWELNDLARRLDEQSAAAELRESAVAAPPEPSMKDSQSISGGAAGMQRVLAAIDGLPEDEREVLNLVRLQGMSHSEAAEVIGVSNKTIQRRLNRCLILLAEQLGDLLGSTADLRRTE